MKTNTKSMIKSVHIKNFKSVVDLSLDLGIFNVLIGENGCGKSNIIEAIAFGAAASADKLDYEFLGSRGIRVTNPDFMYSAFTSSKKKKSIDLSFSTDETDIEFKLVNEVGSPKKWVNKNKDITIKEINRIFKALYLGDNEDERNNVIKEIFEDDKNIEDKKDKEAINSIAKIIEPYRNENDLKNIFSTLYPTLLEKIYSNPELSSFIIYTLEQSSLRRFEETTQIYPLGIKGEGLFQYLKELAFDKKNIKTLNSIKENLALLDWYEDFDLPENLLNNEFTLKIKDRYLSENLQYFDQRSTNEGFLYLLFYFTLFVSKGTPSFFGIDNIDSSLNPKLCMELTRSLYSLAKKFKKQVIITTHNPAILDGLNLKDDNQRLFVIRRNSDGYTKASRIKHNPKRKMKLSEVWTNGFIGGLPENF